MPNIAPCPALLKRALWREGPGKHIFKELPGHHETSRPAPVHEPLLWNFRGGRIAPIRNGPGVPVGEMGLRQGPEERGQAERHGEGWPGAAARLCRGADAPGQL